MKVFLPFKKELNTYLDEIQRYSHCTFVYENYKNYTTAYDIVNIHWPEAIFDWFEPTKEQLSDLTKAITEWKKKSYIVYTKHDVSRHKGMTPNFTKLFEIIEQNTDVFIHLGKYSKECYKKIYPNAKHEIVFHPLYENSFKIYTKTEARKKLNIAQDSVVIIAPGTIRNFAERNMILSAFNKLKVKNKVLIATNMRSEIKYDFRGRVKLKKIFDLRKYVVKRFKEKHLPPKYCFTYNKLNSEDLSLRMSAADIVLIPRIEILNSGNLFLGLTFNKIVVGPATGNIEEQLNIFKLPVFDPNSISSVTEALKKGIVLNQVEYVIPDKNLSKFKPRNIAENMDRIFAKFI